VNRVAKETSTKIVVSVFGPCKAESGVEYYELFTPQGSFLVFDKNDFVAIEKWLAGSYSELTFNVEPGNKTGSYFVGTVYSAKLKYMDGWVFRGQVAPSGARIQSSLAA